MTHPNRILLLLAVACAACGTGARVQAAPPAPRTPVAPPATVVMSESMWRTLPACVADGSGIREVQTRYNLVTGDTLIDGRPIAEVYPTDAGYAAAADWFVRDEMMTLGGRRYIKYGLPRVLHADDVTPVEAYRGVPVFAARGSENDPHIRYVLVRPGCVFQPYEGPEYGAVRG